MHSKLSITSSVSFVDLWIKQNLWDWPDQTERRRQRWGQQGTVYICPVHRKLSISVLSSSGVVYRMNCYNKRVCVCSRRVCSRCACLSSLQENLQGYVQKVFSSITQSSSSCPPLMCDVFRSLRHMASKRFPGERGITHLRPLSSSSSYLILSRIAQFQKPFQSSPFWKKSYLGDC